MKPILILIGALLIVGIMIAIVFRSSIFSNYSEPKQPIALIQPQEMDIRMYQVSLKAVADADARNHVKLDYSVDSLRTADRILGEFHDQYVRDKSSVDITDLAMIYGAYIGEVIRRDEPTAHWSLNHPVAGKNSFPLNWSAGDSFPCSWAYRRIIEGSADDVWGKYEFYKTHPTEGKSLAHAEATPAKSQ